MKLRLLSFWLHAVSLLVPSGERGRWRDEWHADIADVEATGAGVRELIGLALGIGSAAATFRFEGMTMDGWMKEVVHAVRGLLRRPAFAIIAVTTLGLGIGANTAIFSVVNGVILQPLQYPESEGLVLMTSSFPTMGFEDFWVSPPEYMQVSERVRSFQQVGAFNTFQINVGADDQPVRVQAASVNWQMFETLRVTPMLGRYFTEDEDQPGGPNLALLSYDFWQNSFGGDASIVGRTIEVNGAPTDVIGVMPEHFDIDESGAQIWVPLQLDWSNRNNFGSHFLFLVGRLAPGATFEGAQNELNTFVQTFQEEIGAGHLDPETHPLHMVELQEEVIGEIRPALMVLLGAVGFVLLIACANVANLLLARAQDRHKEVSVRAAMGAGHGRLLRQFLTEGIVLSILGALLGTGLAMGSLRLLKATSPGDIPRLSEVALDGQVLLFTTLIAVATGIIFGLAPTRHVATSDLAKSLRDGGTRSTSSAGQRRLRSLLVVSETALALILAVGAGLMIRSFGELTSVEPGFEPDGLLTFQVFLPPSNYPDATDRFEFHQRVTDELLAQPAVQGVATMSGLPPIRRMAANDTEFENFVTSDDAPPQNVDHYQAISSEYLETMQIEIIEGRGFLESDDANGVPVALVNRVLAEKFWPGESAIGKRLRPGFGGPNPFLEVVGVVGDVKNSGLDVEPGTELYFHDSQYEFRGGLSRLVNFVVRTSGDPVELATPARQAVWSRDAALPISGLQPMSDVMGEAMSRARFLTALLAAFAGLALLLAAVGTYGVMSYAVTQRGREMGIRMAMGAQASAVHKLILTEGLKVAVIGLALGIAGAWGLTGLLESLLFEVDARDPASFVIGPVLLTLVAIAACWISGPPGDAGRSGDGAAGGVGDPVGGAACPPRRHGTPTAVPGYRSRRPTLCDATRAPPPTTTRTARPRSGARRHDRSLRPRG